MAELWFDADADISLTTLEADTARVALAHAIHRVLDQLQRDAGDRSVRRRRFHVPGLWCVTVGAAAEEWAVLWEPHPDHPDDVVVHYIGPASFS